MNKKDLNRIISEEVKTFIDRGAYTDKTPEEIAKIQRDARKDLEAAQEKERDESWTPDWLSSLIDEPFSDAYPEDWKWEGDWYNPATWADFKKVETPYTGNNPNVRAKQVAADIIDRVYEDPSFEKSQWSPGLEADLASEIGFMGGHDDVIDFGPPVGKYSIPSGPPVIRGLKKSKDPKKPGLLPSQARFEVDTLLNAVTPKQKEWLEQVHGEDWWTLGNKNDLLTLPTQHPKTGQTYAQFTKEIKDQVRFSPHTFSEITPTGLELARGEGDEPGTEKIVRYGMPTVNPYIPPELDTDSGTFYENPTRTLQILGNALGMDRAQWEKAAMPKTDKEKKEYLEMDQEEINEKTWEKHRTAVKEKLKERIRRLMKEKHGPDPEKGTQTQLGINIGADDIPSIVSGEGVNITGIEKTTRREEQIEEKAEEILEKFLGAEGSWTDWFNPLKWFSSSGAGIKPEYPKPIRLREGKGKMKKQELDQIIKEETKKFLLNEISLADAIEAYKYRKELDMDIEDMKLAQEIRDFEEMEAVPPTEPVKALQPRAAAVAPALQPKRAAVELSPREELEARIANLKLAHEKYPMSREIGDELVQAHKDLQRQETLDDPLSRSAYTQVVPGMGTVAGEYDYSLDDPYERYLPRNLRSKETEDLPPLPAEISGPSTSEDAWRKLKPVTRAEQWGFNPTGMGSPVAPDLTSMASYDMQQGQELIKARGELSQTVVNKILDECGPDDWECADRAVEGGWQNPSITKRDRVDYGHGTPREDQERAFENAMKVTIILVELAPLLLGIRGISAATKETLRIARGGKVPNARALRQAHKEITDVLRAPTHKGHPKHPFSKSYKNLASPEDLQRIADGERRLRKALGKPKPGSGRSFRDPYTGVKLPGGTAHGYHPGLSKGTGGAATGAALLHPEFNVNVQTGVADTAIAGARSLERAARRSERGRIPATLSAKHKQPLYPTMRQRLQSKQPVPADTIDDIMSRVRGSETLRRGVLKDLFGRHIGPRDVEKVIEYSRNNLQSRLGRVPTAAEIEEEMISNILSKRIFSKEAGNYQVLSRRPSVEPSAEIRAKVQSLETELKANPASKELKRELSDAKYELEKQKAFELGRTEHVVSPYEDISLEPHIGGLEGSGVQRLRYPRFKGEKPITSAAIEAGTPRINPMALVDESRIDQILKQARADLKAKGLPVTDKAILDWAEKRMRIEAAAAPAAEAAAAPAAEAKVWGGMDTSSVVRRWKQRVKQQQPKTEAGAKAPEFTAAESTFFNEGEAAAILEDAKAAGIHPERYVADGTPGAPDVTDFAMVRRSLDELREWGMAQPKKLPGMPGASKARRVKEMVRVTQDGIEASMPTVTIPEAEALLVEKGMAAESELWGQMGPRALLDKRKAKALQAYKGKRRNALIRWRKNRRPRFGPQGPTTQPEKIPLPWGNRKLGIGPLEQYARPDDLVRSAARGDSPQFLQIEREWEKYRRSLEDSLRESGIKTHNIAPASTHVDDLLQEWIKNNSARVNQIIKEEMSRLAEFQATRETAPPQEGPDPKTQWVPILKAAAEQEAKLEKQGSFKQASEVAGEAKEQANALGSQTMPPPDPASLIADILRTYRDEKNRHRHATE